MENIDGIHTGSGPAHERRRYGIARQLLGPRLALALKQSGVFDSSLLDDSLANAQTGDTNA